jgi:hypothetical protein
MDLARNLIRETEKGEQTRREDEEGERKDAFLCTQHSILQVS